MDNFNKILDDAKKICKGMYVETNAGYFSTIYPFTTENISGYINEFSLENKSLLTVGSSADQILNAILYGCKSITLFDINPFVKFHYYLKIACILTIEKEEFLEFLRFIDYPKVFKNNKNCLNLTTFKKIKDTLFILDYDSYNFWCEIFKKFSPLDIRENLFSKDEDRTYVIEKCNPYLTNDSNYLALRKKLENSNPKFITANLLKDKIDGNFDNIWLSNIAKYLMMDQIKQLVDNVIKASNKNSLILISYLYQTTIDTLYNKEWEPIYNLPEILKLLKDYNPYLASFTGVKGFKFKDEEIKDSVILCRKP